MKTKYFILAAIAAVGLASCADDVFVGDNSPNVVEETTVDDGSIRFSGGFKAITRADHVGADAASMLNNKFVVGGFKGSTTAATGLVFDNYVVKWTENTAGTTESNTSDWEYVGITGSNLSPVTSVTTQTIKYWDYSQVLYDFVAYSTGTATAVSTTPTDGEIKVTAFNTTDHSFTLTGGETDLTKCYIADRVTVLQADFGKEVTLSFRNLAAKVRVALYETIPGYSVKKVEFYHDDGGATGTGINANISSNTDATLIGTFYTGGSYNVTYPGTTSGQPDFNKAHVTFTSTSYPNDTYRTFGALNLTTGEGTKTDTQIFLKTSSNDPSFAGTSTYYQTVLPNEVGGAMVLRINYTLEANDGQGEEITVHGAKAYVPAGFAQWLPNYAYTYIFKISDNSNGWTSTSETDPAGLYPITFDAVVVDSEENTQTTITTVATPSITTYQKGHVYTDGPEYAAGSEDIYVQVMMNGTLVSDLATKGQLYTLSADETEAEVLNALSIQEYTSVANTIAGRNKLTLTEATSAADFTTIPREDGNTISITAGQAASFDATAGTYAYVYDTGTYNDGIGVSFAEQPADWAHGNYYTNAACTTPATSFVANTTYYQKKAIRSYVVTTTTQPTDWGHADYYTDEACTTKATTWAANTNYYKKFIVDNKIYGVKVIKVQ